MTHFIFELVREQKKGGLAVLSRSVINPRYFDEASCLIEKLYWSGVIDIDYLVDGDGKIYLLEINPRFSGTTQFAYNCGVDIPRMYFDFVTGQRQEYKAEKYHENILYRSIFPEEIHSLAKDEESILTFFRDFLRPRVTYDFSLMDLRLFLWQLRKAKWALAR